MIKINVKNKTHFKLYGSTALDEMGYKRFSEAELNNIKNQAPKVYELAKDSAGIQAHFMTDSSIIIASTKLNKPHSMTNTSPLGQAGMDLYMFDEQQQKYTLVGVSRPPLWQTKYDSILVEFDQKKMRKFILNLPLLASVESLTLTFEDSQVLPLESYQKRIMMYGTSILHGVSVSRPGMSYANILSRRLNIEILNYGFNGSAFNEPVISEVLSKREVDLLIIDSEANSNGRHIFERLETFIDTFRLKQPNTPIVITNRIPFIKDYFNASQKQDKDKHEAFLLELSKRKDIHYVDVYQQLKDDLEITADGVHLNDYGQVKMADIFETIILKYLK